MIDALERLRALRRDGYRCQYRDPLGVPCDVPTGRVGLLKGIPSALCRTHDPREETRA